SASTSTAATRHLLRSTREGKRRDIADAGEEWHRRDADVPAIGGDHAGYGKVGAFREYDNHQLVADRAATDQAIERQTSAAAGQIQADTRIGERIELLGQHRAIHIQLPRRGVGELLLGQRFLAAAMIEMEDRAGVMITQGDLLSLMLGLF